MQEQCADASPACPPRPVNTSDTLEQGCPPQQLPPHLQHAVHRALSDLQASRLLYPQRCAAAEAHGGSDRAEAERRGQASLGGTFSYSSAKAQLDEAQSAAKQLQRTRGQTRSSCTGGGAHGGERSPRAAPVTSPPAPAPTSAEANVWRSFEAFSAAVAAEVDQRIAAARLKLQPAAKPGTGEGRLRRRQLAWQPDAGRQAERGSKAAAGGASGTEERRHPLGSTQRHPAGGQPCARPQERKRERDHSPNARPGTAPAAEPSHAASRSSRRQLAAAPTTAPAAGSPASKRQRPHVAFGSRCDAPRTAASRGAKPVRLEASTAPTPPALPPAQPEAAQGGREAQAGGPPGAAAGAAPRSDLLRSLAQAFAGAGDSVRAEQPGGDVGPAFAVQAGSGGPEQLQAMLEHLTAALQGLEVADRTQACGAGVCGSVRAGHGADPLAPPGFDGSDSLLAALEQHGIGPSTVDSAGSLLQAVLERMDDIADRARGSPAAPAVPSAEHAGPAGGEPLPSLAAAAGRATPDAPQQAATCSEGLPCSDQAADGCEGSRSEAVQLCRRYSELLGSTDAELRQVRRDLEAARRADAALEAIQAAALQSALGAAEAAAGAAAEAAAECVAGRAAVQPRHPGAGAWRATAGEAEVSWGASAVDLDAAAAPSQGQLAQGSSAGLSVGHGQAEALQPACSQHIDSQTTASEAVRQQDLPCGAYAHAAAAIDPPAQQAAEIQAGQVQPAATALAPTPPPALTLAVGWPIQWPGPPSYAGQPAQLAPAAPAAAGLALQHSQPMPLPPVQGAAEGAAASGAGACQPDRSAYTYIEQEQECSVAELGGAGAEAGPSFAVGCDLPLYGSPGSPVSIAGEADWQSSGAPVEAGSPQQRQGHWRGQEAEQQQQGVQEEQAALDELAALNVQQSHQGPADGSVEMAAEPGDEAPDSCTAAAEPQQADSLPGSDAAAGAEATGAGDSATRIDGSPVCGAGVAGEPSAAWFSDSPGSGLPSDSVHDAQELGLAVAAMPPAADSVGWHAPSGAEAAAATTSVPAVGPPAARYPTMPAQPRPAYNPLKADEERAVAARRAEDAAGWRALRQRADMLALWHEYASELGLHHLAERGAEVEGGGITQQGCVGQQPPQQLQQNTQLEQGGCGQLEPKFGGQAGAPVEAGRLHSGVAARAVSQQPQQRLRLWQPQVGAAEHASSPALASAGTVDASIVSPSSLGQPTPVSSRCLTDSSDGSSLGVAARHKARALRFRLLRRQVASAAGMGQSLLASPTESTLSHSSSSSSSVDGSSSSRECGSSASGSPCTGTAGGPAVPLPPGRPAVVIRVPARGDGMQQQEQEWHSEAPWGPTPGADDWGELASPPEEAGQPPATPLAATQALAAAEAAFGGAAAAADDSDAGPGALVSRTNLADHLSDATPSSLASVDPEQQHSASPCAIDSPSASSSCSTLQEVGAWPACGSARASEHRLSASFGGSQQRLAALHALKARMAEGRRSGGRRSLQ